MTTDAWLRTHPYLEPVARFCAQVDAALAQGAVPTVSVPSFDDCLADHVEGVPLLSSPGAAIDLAPAGAAVCLLADALAAGAAGARHAAAARALGTELRESGPQRVVDWLLRADEAQYSSPGLLRFLGWTTIARALRPVVAAFAAWRNEERWQRRYCPLCGSLPAMSQLIGVDPGRIRLLACGCCGTRWRYRRTACPFCDDDSQRIAALTVEGEAALRIDWCEACHAYLKTYAGHGDEAVLLADWTSLHLDVIAHERALQRQAVSLFSVEELLR